MKKKGRKKSADLQRQAKALAEGDTTARLIDRRMPTLEETTFKRATRKLSCVRVVHKVNSFSTLQVLLVATDGHAICVNELDGYHGRGESFDLAMKIGRFHNVPAYYRNEPLPAD